MTARLTPWFPADVKPVRAGAYQRKVPGGSAYWWWTGEFWAFGGDVNVKNCRPIIQCRSVDQRLPWRGLASDPAVSK